MNKKNREEFMELMKTGTDSTRQVCEKYMGLIDKLVGKYVSVYKIDFEDGKGYATTGIFKAIRNYKSSKLGSDITYLSMYIIHELSKLLRESSTIPIPQKVLAKIYKTAVIRNDLYSELGRDPTIEEIASKMSLTTEEVNDLINLKLQRYEGTTTIEDDYGGNELPEKNEAWESDNYDRYSRKEYAAIDRYIDLLTENEQMVIGFEKGIKTGLKDYEIREKLNISEGQLDRKKKKVKDKLVLIRTSNSSQYPENMRNDVTKNKPTINPKKKEIETRQEFLKRVTQIAFRLFPDTFLYTEELADENLSLMRIRIISKWRVTSTQSGQLVFTPDNKTLETRIPYIIKFLLSFHKQNDDIESEEYMTLNPFGLPSKIQWIDIVRSYGAKVYKHQMVEFFKALKASTGTISRYCNEKKEGVIFKKDEMEEFYKKVDGYLEKNETTTIPFKIVKKITGADFNDLKEYVDDGKIKYPYSVNFIKQELCR